MYIVFLIELNYNQTLKKSTTLQFPHYIRAWNHCPEILVGAGWGDEHWGNYTEEHKHSMNFRSKLYFKKVTLFFYEVRSQHFSKTSLAENKYLRYAENLFVPE